MARDQPLPVHGNHFLQPVLDVGKEGVGHGPERHRFQRNPIDGEDDLLLRQPHHQRAVGVVLADIDQLERRVAERHGPFAIDNFVRHNNIRPFQCLDPRLGILVRNEDGAQILERLSAGDVVEGLWL